MSKERGFTLIEALCAIAVSTALLGAVFLSLNQFQRITHQLSSIMEQDEHIRLAPLLLIQWLAGAGNWHWAAGDKWSSLTINSASVQVNSDLSGRDGFPDGSLEDRFESITLRHSSTDLQIKSGRGTFQPFAKGVDNWHVELEGESEIKIVIVPRNTSGKGSSGSDPFTLKVYLWNRIRNLFPEEVP